MDLDEGGEVNEERIEGERESEPREAEEVEMEEGNVEDESTEPDVETPRASLPPQGKYTKKKRKRCSSEESSAADVSPNTADKKKVKGGPLSNTNKSINVGKEFQAEIEENKDLTNYKDYMPDREHAYWKHGDTDVDNDALENFVNIQSKKYLLPIDKILFILMEKKMNFHHAALEISKRNILQDGWKDDERFIFENSFTHIGKNFHQMHAAIAHRSLRSIIHYYYESKKTITYRSYAAKTSTEIDDPEEYESTINPFQDTDFEDMCQNCGERAEDMKYNDQMKRTECNACLIYFSLMGVPRPTTLHLVMSDRWKSQAPCPDSMRDLMKSYERLSAPATGKTFEQRLVRDMFSLERIMRADKQVPRQPPPRFLKTDTAPLPINRNLRSRLFDTNTPSTSAASDPNSNDEIAELNGVVNGIQRNMEFILGDPEEQERQEAVAVEVEEEPEVKDEVKEEEKSKEATTVTQNVEESTVPDEVLDEEVKVEDPVEKSTVADNSPEEAEVEDPEEATVPQAEPEKEASEPSDPAADEADSLDKSEKFKKQKPVPATEDAVSAEALAEELEKLVEAAPESTDAPKEPNPDFKAPEPSESMETPRKASPEKEKSPKKSVKKSGKLSNSSSSRNVRSLSATPSKQRKLKKPFDSSTPATSNCTPAKAQPAEPGPSMYIWHNKRKTQCQEEMEVLLDDSRRKLFSAGQHSSKIDYKAVTTWKKDMDDLRKRMSSTHQDPDLHPFVVLSGDRARQPSGWSEQDQINIQRCFKWYGPNFQVIADVMGNKTADQIYNFYTANQTILEEHLKDHTEFEKYIKAETAAADERKKNNLSQ